METFRPQDIIAQGQYNSWQSLPTHQLFRHSNSSHNPEYRNRSFLLGSIRGIYYNTHLTVHSIRLIWGHLRSRRISAYLPIIHPSRVPICTPPGVIGRHKRRRNLTQMLHLSNGDSPNVWRQLKACRHKFTMGEYWLTHLAWQFIFTLNMLLSTSHHRDQLC